MNLEALLTSPKLFGLTTATNLQRGICRAAEGLDLGLSDEEIAAFFGTRPTLGFIPSLVVLVCGVRSGKSLIAVCAALYCSLSADLSQLLPHERARTVIVAPTVLNAENTFRLLVGAINSSKTLKAIVVGEPTSDRITIRRADGKFVEIVVVAAHRGAVALRGTWLCGFILEETAFFGTDATGYVVNAEELLKAGETRLVPGGQGWVISSPMAESGLLYDLWKTYFGKPGEVLVVHAPTLAMNYITVNRQAVEEIRKRDPDAAAREYDAVFAGADTALIPSQHIDDAMYPELERGFVEGQSYVAAMDPATRGNAWTLVVATKNAGAPRQSVVFAKQWIGSKTRPLDPDVVLMECADILNRYGVNRAATDQWSADANRAIARRHGLTLYDLSATATENVDIYQSMATKFADGEIEVPTGCYSHINGTDVSGGSYIRNDLLGIRRKISSRISIVLLKTPDGRHCDFAPAIARVLDLTCREPAWVPPKAGTPEYYELERKNEKEAAKALAAKYAKAELRELLHAVKARNPSRFKRLAS